MEVCSCQGKADKGHRGNRRKMHCEANQIASKQLGYLGRDDSHKLYL